MIKKNKRRGFSFVEIVVVVAVLAVLAGVLAPALISHVELSRMQRDESAMDEVVNAVQLALTDADLFDEAYSYCVKNNYLTYSDSSGKYGQTISDEEFWAPDGSGAAVTITFNPDGNGNYDISKGLVNDMTYGNGSVAEQRNSDAQQCYLYEMGNQALYKAIEQSIGSTINESSATYKNSSYTVFMKFNVVDGTRKVDVYGQFNGTNLSEGCPAAIGTQTSSYENDQPVIKKTGGIQAATYTSSDLSGSGTLGSFTLKKPLATYKQCKDGHTFDVTNPDKPLRCVCTVCFITQHTTSKYPLRCDICGEILNNHDCTTFVNGECKECGTKAYTFMPKNYDSLTGSTTATDSEVILPDYFISGETRYRIISIGNSAFKGCSNLKKIVLPQSLKRIENEHTLNGIGAAEITIPKSITFIGQFAFYGSQITNFNYAGTMSEWLAVNKNGNWNGYMRTNIVHCSDGCVDLSGTQINYCSLHNVVSDGYVIFTDGNKLTWQQLKDSENKEKYSYSMTENNYSVSKFSNNVKEIVLPNTITTIGNSAFKGCSNLKKIVLPQSLKRIENEHTLNGIGAAEITIPKSITFIGQFAFYGSQITNFNYAGTMSEWLAVNKNGNWNGYMRTNIVHCSDGCVDLSGAQITCPTHGTAGTQG